LEAEQQFTVLLIYQLFLDFCMVHNILQMHIAKKLPLYEAPLAVVCVGYDTCKNTSRMPRIITELWQVATGNPLANFKEYTRQ
jgi:hypothetical protein